MDLQKKFPPNQWIVSQTGLPAFFVRKLLKGRVGIYEEGEKIATIEVSEGMKPKWLGFTSSLSQDFIHKASIKTETEVEVDTVYTEHIWGLLKNEVPNDIQEDIKHMVEAINVGGHIKGLKIKLSKVPKIDLKIQPDYDSELLEILQELKDIYEHIMSDEECMNQSA